MGVIGKFSVLCRVSGLTVFLDQDFAFRPRVYVLVCQLAYSPTTSGLRNYSVLLLMASRVYCTSVPDNLVFLTANTLSFIFISQGKKLYICKGSQENFLNTKTS